MSPVVCEMWFVWRPVLPDGVDLFAWISGLALGGNTTLAKWRRITGRVITGHCRLPGAILTRGGEIAVLFLNVLAAGRIELEDVAGEMSEIAVLFLNVLAAGRIELEDEAGETGGIAILFLNVLAGLSGAILTGGAKLVQ
jgi:hypothetical protein